MSIFFHSFLYILYLSLLVRVVFKWSFFEIEGTQKKHFAFFFLLKVAAGVLFTLIYTYYYTDQTKADIYRYFKDSKVIASVLFIDPVAWLKIMTGYGVNEPEVFKYVLPTQYFSHPGSDIVTNNTFIIRINVLLNYLSFNNIYINTLFLNFISFIGLTALFKALRPYFSQFQQILYVPIFLLPSVLFWSSGLLKESLLFAGLGFYLFAWLSTDSNLLRGFLMTVTATLTLMLVKLQVGVLTVFLFSAFLFLRRNSVSVLLRLALLLVISALGFYFLGNDVSRILIEKRNEFAELALTENSGSSINSTILEPTITNLIKLLPEAFINSVLRPFVWDGGKVFQKVFAVENLFFLLLLLIPLHFFKVPKGEKSLLCLAFLFFALANYMIIGITVPVMGAIVHYRIIAEPFLLLSVLLCVDLGQLKQYLSRFAISSPLPIPHQKSR